MSRFRALLSSPTVSQPVLTLAVLLLSAGAASVVSAQDDRQAPRERAVDGKAAASWAATFQPPGVNGPVYATAQIGDLVYVGGDFTEAGSVQARDLAAWDTEAQKWVPVDLPWDALLNDRVMALTVHDGRLYIGGHFKMNDAQGRFLASNIISLKNGTVEGYGDGLYQGNVDSGVVYEILVRTTGSTTDPEIYAAGDFRDAASGTSSIEGFARWDGSQWSAPGTLTSSSGRGVGHTLALAGPDSIVVGGDFEEVQQGSSTTSNIAGWDIASETWYSYARGIRGPVYTIDKYEREISTGFERVLHIGGDFGESYRDKQMHNVGYWDPNTQEWERLDERGVTEEGSIDDAIVYALSSGPNGLQVGGVFTEAGTNDVPVYNVASYASGWSAWAGGVGRDRDLPSVRTLFNDPNTGTVVGGEYSVTGDPSQPSHRKVNHVAAFDGTTWSALGQGVERGSSKRIYDVVPSSGGDVYVGGDFEYIGGVPANGVARWDGSGWDEVGGGVDGSVRAVAVQGGEVVVGGNFTTADPNDSGVSASNVARWDGGQWTALGNGTDDVVRALAWGPNNLYVGGEFTSPGQYLAQWDGSSWGAVGGGTGYYVYALSLYAGDLYVGGRFTSVGNTSADHIARWDGSAWHALGQGVNSWINAIDISSYGEVYVGGLFDEAGGQTANHVARWYQGTWYPLGDGTDDAVWELSSPGECQVYAAGSFGTAGGGTAGGIAGWNGRSWSSFSGGLLPSNSAIYGAAQSGSDVFVGGTFRGVTGPSGTAERSHRIGRWGDGFPGGAASAPFALIAPSAEPLYYAAVDSIGVEVTAPSEIQAVALSVSMDGGTSWTSINRLQANQDSLWTTWKVPDSTSASQVMLRARAVNNPCLTATRTYDYLHSQNAGDRVTHLYRTPSSGTTEYFYPEYHGYPFENTGDDVWPSSVRPSYSNASWAFVTFTGADPSYFPSWDIFCDAVSNDCYKGPFFVELTASFWQAIAQGGFRGACAGFAATSMLAFENNSTVLGDLPVTTNDSLYKVTAADGRRPVAKYFTRELSLGFIQNALTRAADSPNETLRKVRTMLDQTPGSGRTFRTLTIWTLGEPRNEIDFTDPQELQNLSPMGHAVTPYRVVQDRSNPDLWYIYVYDNNHANGRANNHVRITVNTAENSWNLPDRWATDEGYSGTGPGAGLFLAEDVQNYVNPRSYKRRTSSSDSATVSRRAATSAPRRKDGSLLDTHVRMLNTQGASVSVQDPEGNEIAYEEGVVINDLGADQALPLLIRSGRPAPPIGFVVPNDRGYSVEASQFPEKTFRMSLEEDSTRYAFERGDADPEETDRYAYGTDGLGVSNPDDSDKLYRARAILTGGETERAYTLDDLRLPQSDGDLVTVNRSPNTAKANGAGALTVTNEGPSTSFDLRLRRLGEEGRTRFSHFDVPVPEAGRLRIEPDWENLQDAPVTLRVDHDGDGSADSTRALVDEPAAPTNLSAQVDVEGGRVELQWAAPRLDDPAGYNVYRASSPFEGPAGATRLNDDPISGTTYVHDADAGGTQYYRVTAVGASGNEGPLSTPAESYLYPQSLTVGLTRSFGEASEAADYRLVALPGDIDGPLPSMVEGDPGTEWQAWWDDGSDTDYLRKFDGGERFAFRPGRGFWLTSTQEWTVETSVPTVSLRSDTTARIPVHDGWNIIANPLDVDVSWNAVEAATEPTLQPLWQFEGRFARADSFRSAKAGTAYYFLNDAGLDSLTIPHPKMRNREEKSTATEADPSLLTLVAEPETDEAPPSAVQVGFDPGADRRLGPLDQPAPPGRFSKTSLRLRAPGEGTGRGRVLAREVRPPPSGPEDGQVFRLRLDTDASGPIKIAAQGRDALGAHAAALLHPATGKSYDLPAEGGVQIREADSTTLRLAVGSESFIQDRVEAVAPEEVQLTAYPNPLRNQGTLAFALPESGRVELAIYDVLGRRMATLVQGRRPAGRHRVEMDAGDLASGVYFGRLEVGDRTRTQKITVVR